MSLTAEGPAPATTETPRSPAPGERRFLLRRYMPRGLFWRTFLIVVVPMVLLQAIVAYLFLADHETKTTASLTRSMIDQVALVVQLAKGADNEAKRQELMAEASGTLGLSVSYLPGQPLPAEPGTTGTEVGSYIGSEMAERIKEPHWFDAQRFGENVDLRVAVPGGTLRFLIERKRFININMHILPIWMGIFSLILLAIAILFLKNQVRPISRLAAAADAFGRGRDVPDYRPSGASEVRQAAIALIGMKKRLMRQMAQRTEMLAGVSHDLRTPLTRMKLELAMMPPDEVAGLRSDVLEMERMLEGYLAFARGEGGEQGVRADLDELVTEIAEEARRQGGRSLEVHAAGGVEMEVRRNALKRCLVNLVDNALKYGKQAVLTVQRDGAHAEIIVDDDGPGIPLERRAEAFRPFRRLESGRNLEQGGIGLGLAIARDIARGHGGDILLGDSPLGGLRATVRIPL